jgi:hypothetical protein
LPATNNGTAAGPLLHARHEDVVAAHHRSRHEAEQTVRASAEALAVGVAREAAEHELRVVLRAAEHGAVEMVEDELAEGGRLFSEVVDLVLLPGKVGIEVMLAVFGRSSKGSAQDVSEALADPTAVEPLD